MLLFMSQFVFALIIFEFAVISVYYLTNLFTSTPPGVWQTIVSATIGLVLVFFYFKIKSF